MKPKKLADIDRKVPFTVPDGYFEQLTTSIQQRIQEKPKQRWIPQRQLQWTLVAASMSLLLMVGWLLWPTQDMTAEQLLAEVSEQDLIAYLDFQELSEDDLLEGVNNDILEELWSDDDALEDLNLDELNIEDILLEYENEINLQES